MAGEEGQQKVYLMDHARVLSSEGSDWVEIPGRGGRPARTAVVQLAATAVRVPPPQGTPQRKTRPTLAAWVVRVWEDAPPAGVEPLEWVLLIAMRTEGLEQAEQRRDWCGVGWGTELFHDVEENGCSEEDRRFETAGAMLACLAMLAILAVVRVLQMRLAFETIPEGPA